MQANQQTIYLKQRLIILAENEIRPDVHGHYTSGHEKGYCEEIKAHES